MAAATHFILFGLYPALLCAAIGTDIARRIIPNILVLALLAGFALLALLAPLDDLSLRVLAAAAVTGVGFTLFAHDIIGAGDAKFAGALSLWMDPVQIPLFIIGCGLIGAGLTLAATVRANGRALPLPIAFLTRAGESVPYGVALAGAGLLLHPWSSLMALA
ncbi:A24 family peptidase [Xanthobacter sp. TB0139]|uniref:A24 family peptidase n=1 Tax=Xanthobacter sp. TB0139 TaxID=3459178 RepID=UPI00403A7BC2